MADDVVAMAGELSRRGLGAGAVIAISTGTFLAGCVGGCVGGSLMSGDSSSSREDRFIEAIRDEGISIPRDRAVQLAHEACNTFERKADATRSEVALAAAIRQNLPAAKAAFFVGAAVATYCPEYDSRPW